MFFSSLGMCRIIGHYGAGDGNRTHVTSLEGWSSTIELHPREIVVGAAGFEPATPCSQGRCSTKLSHAPQTAKCIILQGLRRVKARRNWQSPCEAGKKAQMQGGPRTRSAWIRPRPARKPRCKAGRACDVPGYARGWLEGSSCKAHRGHAAPRYARGRQESPDARRAEHATRRVLGTYAS